MSTTPDIATIDRLAGELIRPEDEAYDEARTLFAGGFDRRPAVIVRPTSAAEVAEIVDTVRESGLELAVRSGGHSGAGHSVVDGAVVVDLGAMRALEIDAEAQTAWAQTGLTAGEYTDAAGAHGLATGFGDTASVGIGGITLGGGVGFLSRRYGLTIDDVLAAEIVTADGRVLEIDEDNHPDLFWAIRGGGGNFGVVTGFRYRLHEVDQVVGGMLMLPAGAELIREFVAMSQAAPEALSLMASVMPAPPLPFVPADHRGEIVVMVLMCFAGPPDEGAAVLAPFRELAEPIVDMVRPIPYREIFGPVDPDYHPAAVVKNMYLDAVDESDAATILDHLDRSDAPMKVAQLRPLGGAIARVSADATAYAHRDARIMANVASFYVGDEDKAVRQAWVDELAAALRQSSEAAYVNFLTDEGPERVRAAYPGATWERLVSVKSEYDPGNLFRNNQNIPPG